MRGLSLVELMVSLTIGLVVMTSVLSIFANTSTARNEVERTSRQIENGRYASELITDDLLLAGFMGELNVASIAAPGTLPDPCSSTPADWGASVPISIQGYHQGVNLPACLTGFDAKPDSDVLLLRRAQTCVAGVDGCDPVVASKPYVQVSLCSSDSATHRVDVGSGSFDLMQKDCATLAGRRQLETHVYYISTNNGAGSDVPTLKRLEFDGTTYVDVPLVEGIEALHVQYGLDTDNDGAPDIYVADPNDHPAGACNAACQVSNWSNVMTVQLNLLARNIEQSPNHTNAKTYTLGIDTNGDPITFTPGDSYRRHVYSSTVQLMNPLGRRDIP